MTNARTLGNVTLHGPSPQQQQLREPKVQDGHGEDDYWPDDDGYTQEEWDEWYAYMDSDEWLEDEHEDHVEQASPASPQAATPAAAPSGGSNDNNERREPPGDRRSDRPSGNDGRREKNDEKEQGLPHAAHILRIGHDPP